MALKTFKPYTKSTRGTILVDRTGLWKGKPFKSLVSKKNLKKNIEKIFKVNVTKVNIINKKSRIKLTRGRKVKVSGFKKAIITLKKGQSIDLTTGV